MLFRDTAHMACAHAGTVNTITTKYQASHPLLLSAVLRPSLQKVLHGKAYRADRLAVPRRI